MRICKYAILFIWVLAISQVSGCAALNGQVSPDAPGRVERDTFYKIHVGSSASQVESLCGQPASKVNPAELELHQMMPGEEWDEIWNYHPSLFVPGKYAANGAKAYFFQGKVVRWGMPYITKQQYMNMLALMKGGVSEDVFESKFGAPEEMQNGQFGWSIAKYNLLQGDGAVYGGAIQVKYMGKKVISVEMATLVN